MLGGDEEHVGLVEEEKEHESFNFNNDNNDIDTSDRPIDISLQKKEEIVEELVDLLGFGTFQWLMFLVSGFGWFADIAEIFAAGLLLPVIKIAFQVPTSGQAGLISSLTMAGMFFGALVFGSLGDTFGRKITFLLTSFFTLIVGICSAFSWTFGALLVFRFFVGFFLTGNLPLSVSFFAEWIPRNRRDYATAFLTGWSVIATLYVTLLGKYLLVDLENAYWEMYLILLTVPSCLAFFGGLFVPESPRYLICQNRVDDCVHNLRRVSRINKVELPEDLIASLKTSNNICNERDEDVIKTTRGRCSQTFRQVLLLFASKNLRIKTSIMSGIWFFYSVAFYTFQTLAPAMLTDLIGGDDTYLILLVSAPIQLVSIGVSVWSSQRIGFAPTLGCLSLFHSLGLLVFWLFNTYIGVFVSYSIFSFCVGGFFAILYLFTHLEYETEIRTTGFGFCVSMNRLGGIIASPMAGFLYDNLDALACTVFASFSMIACILSFAYNFTKFPPSGGK